jgi:hypothetical protein
MWEGSGLAINLISVGLSVIGSLRDPGGWPSIVSGELKTVARIPGTGYPLSVSAGRRASRRRLCHPRDGPTGAACVDAWIALRWTAEGAWDAIAAGLPVAAGYGAGDPDPEASTSDCYDPRCEPTRRAADPPRLDLPHP